jgi:hypothetical protein
MRLSSEEKLLAAVKEGNTLGVEFGVVKGEIVARGRIDIDHVPTTTTGSNDGHASSVPRPNDSHAEDAAVRKSERGPRQPGG